MIYDIARIVKSYTPFLTGESPLFIGTISSSIVLAFIYWRRTIKDRAGDAPSFWRFLVPESVRTSNSVVQDLWLAILIPPVATLIFLANLQGGVLIAQHVRTYAEYAFGPVPYSPIHHAVVANIIYTFILSVVLDLIFFVFHVACHKNKILWELHKVHHSATVLTPLTDFRSHPLQLLIDIVITPIILAVVTGGLAYLSNDQLSMISFLGANIIIFATHSFGGSLRHSHIPVSFGPLDYVIQSPAMHHVHHSTDPRHHGKNYSGGFVWWDMLLGSFYRPGRGEVITPGLSGEENLAIENMSFSELMLDPFKKITHIITSSRHHDAVSQHKEVIKAETA